MQAVGGQESPAEAIRSFFDTLFPSLGGGFIEFRYLGILGDAEASFFPSVADAVSAALEAATNASDANIYFGVCPRVERRGDKAAVRLVHAMWADLDAKDYAGGKPEALDRLSRHSPPPTIIVDSGNGFHSYWRLRTPIAIDSAETLDLIERRLKSLARSLGADTKAAELARILRVPGTLNLKNLPSQVRVAIVETVPDRQYALADFEASAPVAESTASSTNPPGWISNALDGLQVGNRNDTFTKIAGRLHQSGWTAAEIVALLIPHAGRAQFSSAELGALVKGICGRYPAGNSLRAPSSNSGKPEAESRPLVTVTPAELLSRTPDSITWRVDGVLPTQGVGILAGPAGYGKSWALLDLAVEAALGGKWLGHFPTTAGRVLYIDEESSAELLGIRLRKLLAFKATRCDTLDLYLCVGQGVCLSDAAGIARLRVLLTTLRPNLVIVDSLIRVHRAEENSASDMAAVFGVVKDLVREFDCAFFFADHQRKAGAGETSLDVMLRGSTEKAAFVDTLLSMKRTTVGLVVEHSKSRFAEPLVTFAISIEDPVPGATRVAYVGEAENLKREAMVEEARPFIEKALSDGDWVSRKDLLAQAREARIKEPAVDAALKLMVTGGSATREDRPSKSGRGNKAAHFRLVRGGCEVPGGSVTDREPRAPSPESSRQELGFEFPATNRGESEANSEEPSA